MQTLPGDQFYIYTPKEEEWPVQFEQQDNQNSKLLRYYAQTDEEYLQELRKQMEADSNVIVVQDFIF